MSSAIVYCMWNSHIYMSSWKAWTHGLCTRRGPYAEATFNQSDARVQPCPPTGTSHVRTSRTVQHERDLLGVSASSPNLCGAQEDYQGEQRARRLHGTYFWIHAVFPSPRNPPFIHPSILAVFILRTSIECAPFLACRFRLSATKILIILG
jgi:hypothetical protein